MGLVLGPRRFDPRLANRYFDRAGRMPNDNQAAL